MIRRRPVRADARKLRRASGFLSVTLTRRLIAGAIQAAVVSTGAARASHLLPERLASSEHSHGSVVAGDARFGGVILHGHAVDFDAAKRLRILRLERGGEFAHTTTDGTTHLGLGLDL